MCQCPMSDIIIGLTLLLIYSNFVIHLQIWIFLVFKMASLSPH